MMVERIANGRPLKVSLFPYYVIFCALYAGFLVVVNVLNLGGGGTNAGAVVGAACGAAIMFVHDYGRAPDARERRRLTWGSLFISYAVSMVALSIIFSAVGHDLSVILHELIDRMTPILFGVAFIIVTLLYYLFLGFSYWFFAKIAARKYAKN